MGNRYGCSPRSSAATNLATRRRIQPPGICLLISSKFSLHRVNARPRHTGITTDLKMQMRLPAISMRVSLFPSITRPLPVHPFRSVDDPTKGRRYSSRTRHGNPGCRFQAFAGVSPLKKWSAPLESSTWKACTPSQRDVAPKKETRKDHEGRKSEEEISVGGCVSFSRWLGPFYWPLGCELSLIREPIERSRSLGKTRVHTDWRDSAC